MATLKNELRKLMQRNGFRLIRSNRHLVWTDGNTKFFTSSTGSDWRILMNVERQLKRLKLEGSVGK